MVFCVCVCVSQKCDIYWHMQVLCIDWEQHSRADTRRDRDRKNDSPGEPSGAWPVLHLQHHPHSVLHGNIQGLCFTYFTATDLVFGLLSCLQFVHGHVACFPCNCILTFVVSVGGIFEQVALEKVFNFATTNIFETRVAGRMLADMCRAACKVCIQTCI